MKSDAEADIVMEENKKEITEEIEPFKEQEGVMEVDEKTPEDVAQNETGGDVKIEIPKEQNNDDLDDTGLSPQKLVPHAHTPVKSEDLKILWSMWQFSAISQFFQLFQEGMMLGFIDTEMLESEIINATHDSWIIDLQVRLLRLSTKNRFITPETWIGYLNKEFEKRMTEEERPFKYTEDESFSYTKLSLKERVLTLHFICEMQLERLENFRPLGLFTEIQTTSWRVEPIGKDSKGNIYWLFDDSRLYMESPESPSKKKKGKKEKEEEEDKPTNWSLVCRTAEDWNEFANKFKSSRSALDKQLHRYVNQDLLPLVITDIYNHQVAKEEREKEYQAWLEAEKLRIEEEDRKEALRIVEEEEKKREAAEMAARKTRSANRIETRASRRNPPRELTEEELELQKLGARELRRLQRENRIDRSIIEESMSYSERKRPKKKKKQNQRKRSRVYDSDEEEELTEEDDESFVNSESPPPEKEDDYWYFSCSCGITGDNYDVKQKKEMDIPSSPPKSPVKSQPNVETVNSANVSQIKHKQPAGYHLGITVDQPNASKPAANHQPTVHPSEVAQHGNGFNGISANGLQHLTQPHSPNRGPVYQNNHIQPNPVQQANVYHQSTNYNAFPAQASPGLRPTLQLQDQPPKSPYKTLPGIQQVAPQYQSSPNKYAPAYPQTHLYQPSSPIHHYAQTNKPISPQRSIPQTIPIDYNSQQLPNRGQPNANVIPPPQSPRKTAHNSDPAAQNNNDNPLMSLVAAIHSNENE
ncbi:hypothetical protein HK103_000865 [Boothiomyces macroporosus]|uniref:Uncharacterized protein n=1 Tax=Boothiomyces macroporosus TaxID=261099 RepID=A0AAD5Y5B9_9FUNG|nr:hypothetical protein HK103_000865 [Boothiomyces macroporosus]